jgi:hypothetical protein
MLCALPLAAMAAVVALAGPGRTEPPRDPRVRAEFMRANPCPATGRSRGACPGWVVDHRIPLCAGGADAPANMQWITRARAREKDQEDIRYCAWLRRHAPPAH